MGIRFKLTLLFAVVTLLPMVVVGFLSYVQAKNTLTKSTSESLSALASEQKARVSDLAQIYHERLDLIPAGTNLTQLLSQYNQSGGTQAQIGTIINDAKGSVHDLEELSVLGQDGTVIASTNPAETGLNRAETGYFKAGQSRQLRPDIFKDTQGRLLVRLAGPLQQDGQTVGELVLTYPAVYLETIANDHSGLGESGEYSIVARTPTGDAVAITPLRFEPDSVLKTTAPKEATNRPANQALAKHEATRTNLTDYRGHKVLAATRYLDDFDWGLVVKVDQSEAYMPINDLRNALLLVALVMAGLMLLVIVEIAYSLTRPLLRLTKVTEQIGQGKLSKRAPPGAGDEIGQLGRSVNEMAEALETSRKNLERRGRDRTKELSAVTESAAEAIISADEQGKVIAWNQGAHRMFGYTELQAVGRPLERIMPERYRGLHQQGLLRVRKTGRTKLVGRIIELEGLRKDGSEFPIELSLSMWRSEGRRRFTAIIRDVSERKRIEDEQHLSNQQLRAMIRSVKEYAIFMLDVDGKVASWNEGAQWIKQYTEKEILGKHFSMFFTKEDVKAGKPERALRTAKRTGRHEEEGLRVRKDGTKLWANVLLTALWDQDGKLYGFVEVTRDVSDQHELRRRQEEFISIASHELRTPLTALLGYLSLVQTDQVSAKMHRFLDRANMSAKRLSRLVEDLLNVTRIEEDKVRFKPVVVDPRRLVEEAVEQLHPVADAKHISLTSQNDLNKDAQVKVDADLFAQVLTNLIDNAIKYTHEGGKVRVTSRGRGGHVEIAVADNGIGIHPENLKLVFEKFYREYTELSIDAGGTGLGLFITKQLVERQGGKLRIESEPNKGTTAYVTLPLRPKHAKKLAI